MREAGSHINPYWFYNQVKNGGPWDAKQLAPRYRDYGNFHFGATGRAFGFFPREYMLRQAGRAQQVAGTSQPDWGDPGPGIGRYLLPWGGTPPYGDDPIEDTPWIRAGMDYAERCRVPVMLWHRRRVILWLLGIAGAVLAIWIGYWAVAFYWLGRAATDCSNDVLQEAASTDGRMTATAFERACGATAPLVRIVSVRASTTPWESDNAARYVFVVQGRPDIRLAWDGPDRLSVKCDGGSGRVMRQAVVWYGVAISYD